MRNEEGADNPRNCEVHDLSPMRDGVHVTEIQGPPNDPELVLPEDERERRRRARWAYSQFSYALSSSRAAASIGYQSARAGRTEALAVSKEMAAGNYRILRMGDDGSKWEYMNLELMLEGWRQYSEMHGAIAESGAAVAIGAIDRHLSNSQCVRVLLGALSSVDRSWAPRTRRFWS